MSLYVSVSVNVYDNVYDNPNMILMELKLLSHIPSMSSQHRLILDHPPLVGLPKLTHWAQ